MHTFWQPLLFGQEAEVQRVSLLAWMFQALGPLYGLLLPAVGLLVFIVGLMVVTMNKRPSVIAAYLPFVALPALIGMFGVVHGMIASMSVVANAGATPKPSEIAEGVSLSLFAALVGLRVSFPSFVVVAMGLFVRAVYAKPENQGISEPLK